MTVEREQLGDEQYVRSKWDAIDYEPDDLYPSSLRLAKNPSSLRLAKTGFFMDLVPQYYEFVGTKKEVIKAAADFTERRSQEIADTRKMITEIKADIDQHRRNRYKGLAAYEGILAILESRLQELMKGWKG